MVKEKNITLNIILCILTFGIYSIYWMCEITRDIDTITNNPEKRSGGMVFLLGIVTLTFYPVYWWYQNGTLMEEFEKKSGIECRSNNALYLILAICNRFMIFPFSLINYGMIQADINNYVKVQENKTVVNNENIEKHPVVA